MVLKTEMTNLLQLSGIEILMTEDFATINPTDPLMLGKQAVRRKRNWPDSSDMSLVRADDHEEIINY